ncbi:MAG: ATP-grasp domain-containing protein [bacterium]|nr:ATP-grasp domain-containing protein [bacterium]MBU1918034.1 ATP-grasp domain-containing protein [bacterium]
MNKIKEPPIKKLLIVGAGIFQVSGIQKACALGHHVITIDKDPKAPGFAYAQNHECVSTTDQDNALRVAQKYGIDGVMTLSTEVAVPTVAHIASSLNLPGLSMTTALNATNKLLMSQCFEQNNIPSPKFTAINSITDIEQGLKHTGLPAILKILSSSGSRGAFKIASKDALQQAYKYSMSFSKSQTLILQEFLQGTEVGGEAFFHNNELKFCFVTNKAITGAPHYVPLGHSLPCKYDPDLVIKIKEQVHQAALAVGIANGPVNFDIMLTEQGPKIIEIGARLGGTCLPAVVYHHAGIDSITAAIAQALNEDPTQHLNQNNTLPVAVHLMTANQSGTLESFELPPEIKNSPDVINYHIDKEKGDTVTEFTCGANRIGHVICKGSSWEEAEKRARDIACNVKFQIR